MNDGTIKFVTDWLDNNGIKYELLQDLSLKIFMALGSPRKHTYLGKHANKNIWLECNSNRDSGQQHYFFLVLCTEGHWSGK